MKTPMNMFTKSIINGMNEPFRSLTLAGMEDDKPPLKEIVLFNDGQGNIMASWYVNGKPDQAMIDLFETHIIPTAYRSAFTLHRAVEAIQELNPDHLVRSVSFV